MLRGNLIHKLFLINYIYREGKLDILELLVDAKAEINTEDKFGQSSIFYAIRDGHIDVVEYLIKKVLFQA